METISTLPDKFSWRRMASIGQLYRSAIRNYIILSAAVSLASYILTRVFISISGNTMGSYTIMSVITAIVFYLNPLTFNRRDDTLMTQLPAKPIEKWVFYIIYCLVIIPCIIQGIWYGTDAIYSSIYSVPTLKDSMLTYYKLQGFPSELNINWLMILMSGLQAETLVLLVLYVSLRTQRNRTVKSLLALLGFLLVIGILSGIAGAIIAISKLHDNPSLITEDPQMIVSEVIHMLAITYAIIGIIFFLSLWLTYRCIAKGQVKN